MKKAFVTVALLSIGANAQAFEAVAQVIKVSPITETISRPTQKCWTETREVSKAPHDYDGAVLGTIVGGLIGSQIGKGNGRVAGAAVGAGVGAMVGDRAANADSGDTSATVQRCETVHGYETRVSGYWVTYLYDNWKFTTRMPYDPGSQLRVNVAVTPK
ncbi:MAG: glycine zipper 2TM domain-containing protein [Sulfurifustis sp.]